MYSNPPDVLCGKLRRTFLLTGLLKLKHVFSMPQMAKTGMLVLLETKWLGCAQVMIKRKQGCGTRGYPLKPHHMGLSFYES